MSEIFFIVVSENGLIDIENPSFNLLIAVLICEHDIIFIMDTEIVFFPISIGDEKTTAGYGLRIEIDIPIRVQDILFQSLGHLLRVEHLGNRQSEQLVVAVVDLAVTYGLSLRFWEIPLMEKDFSFRNTVLNCPRESGVFISPFWIILELAAPRVSKIEDK